MPADPIHDDTIPIRASALKQLHVIAGVDRGCSLTKIAFITKDTSLDDAEFVPLRCLTFLNANFEDALHVLKSQALLPTSGTLQCCGVGCANYHEQIKDILGLDISIMPEQLCIMRGMFLTLTNTKLEDIILPTPSFKTWAISSDYLDEAFKGNTKVKEHSSPFPAGITHIGSGAGVGLIDAEGKAKFVGMTPLCGKTFMGLARMLLGTNDYDEIMELAARGDRGKLDYQIRDMLDEDTLDYGQFPMSMPIFPFGKLSMDTWTDTNVTRADKATSLVGFFVGGILMTMLYVARMVGIKRFYVSGNFTRAEIARSLMLEAVTLLKGDLDVKFLATGHSPVIATMMSTAEDTLEKWIVKELDL